MKLRQFFPVLFAAIFLGLMPTATRAADKGKADQGKAAADDMGVIEGLTIARSGRPGFLGLQVVDGNFKLSFYDEKKKPVDADFTRALLRWPVRYQPADMRTLLNVAGDGKSLTSGTFVRPPYNFQLFITLLGKEDTDKTESYSISFQQ
ncbi:MAG: hypothetical protein ACHQ4G_00090 [Opitutales bacterium]